VIAVAVGFALTAPGQATFDWVAETIHLKEPAPTSQTWAELRKQESDLGGGTTPEGTTYLLGGYAGGSEGDICVDLSYPPGERAGADLDGDGQAACGPPPKPGSKPLTRLTLVERRTGGAVGLGVMGGTITAITAEYVGADGDPAAAEVDRFPITATVEAGDEESVTAFVVFLPAGVGDLQAGSGPVRFTFVPAGGGPSITDELTYTRWSLNPSELASPDSPIITCPKPGSLGQICHRAANGTLGSVDRGLARPLPDKLVSALGARGYSLKLATAEDRAIAGATYDPFKLRNGARLPGTSSLGVSSLYRVTGHGFDDRLLFVTHNFRIKRHASRSSTASTPRTANPRGLLTDPARTQLMDPATYEVEGSVRW
jgi:hypothetical protein